jgi:alpha-ribazole phosphatase
MDNQYNIVVIRHGITEASKNKMHYGSGTDISLLPEAILELRALKEQGIYPDPEGAILISSGMKRANETLQVLFNDRDFETIGDFREVYLGDFEMLSDEKIKKHPAYQTWFVTERYVTPPPGGESIYQMRDRIFRAMQDLFEHYKANITGDSPRNFIIVCHLGPSCAIMHYLFPGERDDFFAWMIEPGHGYSIEMEGRRALSFRAF